VSKLAFLAAIIFAAGTALGQATPGSYPYPKPLPGSGSTPGGHIRPTATISVSDYSDPRAVAWDVMLGGVDIHVGTIAERDAFPAARRKQGMTCYVTDTLTDYRLGADLTTWVAIPVGGGGGGVAANSIVVQNVAELQTVDPSQWTNVVTRGYYAPGDGGANRYFWVNNASGANVGSKIASIISGSWTNYGIDEVNVRQWGAVGNGIADDTSAIQGAVNEAGNNYRVRFRSGTYRITQRIDVPGTSTTWVGERSTAGAAMGYPAAGGQQFAAVRITFAPAAPTTFLVSEWETSLPAETIGPYIFENLYFDLGINNGLQFGNESIGVGAGGAVQRYVSGVRISGCNFAQSIQSFYPGGNVLSISPRVALHLTKAFESVIADCSFTGGAEQIRFFGCDNPVVRGCRLQYGWNPISYIGSEQFDVQGAISDTQFEAWGGRPIYARNSNLALTRVRAEQVGNAQHVVALPQTATLVAGSSTITMSAPVDGILIPEVSILKLESASWSGHVMVTSVSGVSVGIDTACTTIPVTVGGVTVTRIHGYGPTASGFANVQAANCSVSTTTGSPSFVMIPSGGGNFAISGAQSLIGQTDVGSLCVANKLGSQFFLNGAMSFVGTSPNILADPRDPFVTVSGIRESNGAYGEDPNNRAAYGSLDESLAIVSRRWSYNPKSSGTFNNGSSAITWQKIPVHPNTKGSVHAWRYRAGGPNLLLNDPTLPFETDTSIKIRIKWRAVTGSATISAVAVGYFGTSVISDTAGTSLKTSIYSGAIPTAWAGGRTQATPLVGLEINADADAFIAGVDVIEVDP
jgi:hypothetical protein